MTTTPQLDTVDLLRQVKALYRGVALEPHAFYHFPLGRPLAEQLGYPADLLDRIPAEALASFAGVGYALDLARLAPGDQVLDLGSGWGTDSFAAALLVGPTGRVTGDDMTDEQRAKAKHARCCDRRPGRPPVHVRRLRRSLRRASSAGDARTRALAGPDPGEEDVGGPVAGQRPGQGEDDAEAAAGQRGHSLVFAQRVPGLGERCAA